MRNMKLPPGINKLMLLIVLQFNIDKIYHFKHFNHVSHLLSLDYKYGFDAVTSVFI